MEKLKEVEAEILKGKTVEEILKHLSWREFEEFCACVFEANGFKVVRNLKFRSFSKRFEIDVLAIRGTLVICADCKHWSIKTGSPSTLAEAIQKQVERAKGVLCYLTKNSRLIAYKPLKEILVIPLIVSLYERGIKLHEGVPVVPIFKLNSFLNELPIYVEDLRIVKWEELRQAC